MKRTAYRALIVPLPGTSALSTLERIQCPLPQHACSMHGFAALRVAGYSQACEGESGARGLLCCDDEDEGEAWGVLLQP